MANLGRNPSDLYAMMALLEKLTGQWREFGLVQCEKASGCGPCLSQLSLLPWVELRQRRRPRFYSGLRFGRCARLFRR